MARTKGAKGKRKNGFIVNSEILQNDNTETQTNQETEVAEENTDTGNTENVGSDSVANADDAQKTYKEILSEFDNIVDAAKTNASEVSPPTEKRGRKSKAELAQEKVKVPGRLFALMVDRVMANGLSIIDSATNKQPETIIPAQWLMADDKTLDELAPIASMSASELGIEEHPTITMFGLLLSNQLSQFMALKALIRQEKKRNPEFDVMDIKPPGK